MLLLLIIGIENIVTTIKLILIDFNFNYNWKYFCVYYYSYLYSNNYFFRIYIYGGNYHDNDNYFFDKGEKMKNS